MQRDLRPPTQGVPPRIRTDVEARLAVQALPHVLDVVVVALARDRDPVGDEEGGVEPDPEHPDHVDVVLLGRAERLHEVGRAGPGDCPEVADHVLLGHADAGVAHGQCLVVGIVLDLHLQLLRLAEQFRLGHAEEAYLVERVGRVGYQLAEEDVLVGVEGVDDDVEHLRHLRLVREGGRALGGGVWRRGAEELLGSGGGGDLLGFLLVIGHFGGGGGGECCLFLFSFLFSFLLLSHS